MHNYIFLVNSQMCFYHVEKPRKNYYYCYYYYDYDYYYKCSVHETVSRVQSLDLGHLGVSLSLLSPDG